MPPPPETRPSLFVRLRDPEDRAAWALFVDAYAAPLYRVARRSGLQDADALDVTQDVLRAVALAVGRFRYDPARGRFRSWLFTLLRNRLADRARRSRLLAVGGSAARLILEAVPAPDGEETLAREAERQLFRLALGRVRARVRPATWEAFARTALGGEPAAAVAGDLGVSTASVYLSRARVTAALKAAVDDLRGELEPPEG